MCFLNNLQGQQTFPLLSFSFLLFFLSRNHSHFMSSHFISSNNSQYPNPGIPSNPIVHPESRISV